MLTFDVYVLDDLDQPEVLVQPDVSAQDLEARRKERGKQPCKLENYLKHVIAYKLWNVFVGKLNLISILFYF